MISTRAMGRDGATLRVQGWDGSSLVAGPLGGAEPLGFAAGDANLYRYVGNGPTDWIDPTGLQQTTPLPPTETVTGISQTAIVELKKRPLSNDPVLLPGGEKGGYRGPCALYAKSLIVALDKNNIKYTLHIYKIPRNAYNQVTYTPPTGGPKTVTVTAGNHVIVEVQTQTGTLLLDAGTGLDPIRDAKTTVELLSNGNFGDSTTGVIAKPNQNLPITGPPENPNKGQPLLRPIGP